MTPPPPARPITLDELIALSDQVRALARCGIPLESGLAAMSQEMPGRQGALARELAQRGQTGQSVDQWLQENSARLPAIFRAIVLAGLRSGRLGVALEGFVTTARRAADLRRIIGISLLYPLLVLVLVSLLASVILRQLVVHYESLRQMGEIHANSPLQWMIPGVRLLGHWVWLVAPLALALALGWWMRTRWALTLQPGRFARWMSWLPGTRRMLRSSFTATFTDLLALLIEQGVALHEAIQLAAQAGGDRATQREADQWVDEITRGGKLTWGRGRQGGISPLVRWLFASQTDSTQLVAALRAHSQAERRRAEYLSEWLRIQLPVILTVGIGGSATLIYALSVLAPWYSLLYDLRGLDSVMAEQSNRNLSREEAQELTERLAEVAGSGLPLADGLWAASCEIPRRRVRRSLRQLAEFVRRGGTLEQAIETGRLPLPAHLAGWLKAGARSGHLVQVLTELTDYYRRSRDVWRQLWLALSYPVMLLGLLAVIVVIVIALVVPDVAALYRDLETELPRMTQSMLWVSLTGWKYFAVSILVLTGSAVLTRLVGGARSWTRFLSSIPGLGRLIHWEGFEQFARLLRLLLLQDVPLPEALRLTADGVSNANVAHISRILADMAEQGQALSTSMQAITQVPGQIIPLVRMGEQNGDLPAAMMVIHELLEGQIVLRSRLLRLIVPPLVFLIVAVVACTVVVSLLLPLMSLTTRL